MAIRIDENSITEGYIDNRKEGITIIKLAFVDGFYTEVVLKGNPQRDTAGRLVSLHHQQPDTSLSHADGLTPKDKGMVGEISAARKSKVPTISLKEVGEYYAQRKKIPYQWKNTLYLEWYTLNGGRCVLEASSLTMTSSEPEWIMTQKDEIQSNKEAEKNATRFFNNIGNLSESRQQIDDMFEKADEQLDEYEWEKLFRHSDKVTDRFQELVDKYEDDDEKIDELMGWDQQKFSIDEPEFTATSFDLSSNSEDWKGEASQFQLSPEEEAQFEADQQAQRNHPIKKKAEEILNGIDSPRKSGTPDNAESWSAMALVCAKIAGALSGYQADGTFEDNGFAIAQLKRVLNHANQAHQLLVKEKHPKANALMGLRQDIIDLQTKLRRI